MSDGTLLFSVLIRSPTSLVVALVAHADDDLKQRFKISYSTYRLIQYIFCNSDTGWGWFYRRKCAFM